MRLEADPEAVLSVPLTLRATPGAIHGRSTVRITVRRLGDAPAAIESDVAFFGPP